MSKQSTWEVFEDGNFGETRYRIVRVGGERPGVFLRPSVTIDRTAGGVEQDEWFRLSRYVYANGLLGSEDSQGYFWRSEAKVQKALRAVLAQLKRIRSAQKRVGVGKKA